MRLEQVTAVAGVNTYVGVDVVGGSPNNSVTTGVTMATIAGGGGIHDGVSEPNTVTDIGGTVGGGRGNVAGNGAGGLLDASYATVAGGRNNTASGNYSAIAGGFSNTASAFAATVAGDHNTASGGYSAVAGGHNNTASGYASAVAGGDGNSASGGRSAVAGGYLNVAGGETSFAAGRQANVRDATASGDANGDEGTFAWADSQAAYFTSTGPNQFLIRAAGGVGVNTNSPSSALDVLGSIKGTSTSANGVEGSSTSPGSGGVYGRALAASGFSVGVRGDSSSPEGIAVWGYSTPTAATGFPIGVEGRSDSPIGVGVNGFAAAGSGVNYAIRGATNSPQGWAGYFVGNVHVTGTLSKGAGSFKIDHPLDPENKYLYHSFVESPDMKNIYDGVVVTDGEGYATVELPEWFEALNRDFRYQLTVVGDGAWARARVARKIEGNRFVVQTDVPSTEVSWQVTGIRKDAFAEKHRIPVEQDKPEAERGRCLYPEACGQPEEKGIDYQERTSHVGPAQGPPAEATTSDRRDANVSPR